jgi:hypothetical protein
MRNFKYLVKIGKEIIEEGTTEDLKIAKKAFKHGRNSHGSIIELNPDGSCFTEVAHKKIGGKLYSWE